MIHFCITSHSFLLQMEAKVMLVHLLRTFSLTLPEDYQVKVTQYIELIHPEGEIPCTATLKK